MVFVLIINGVGLLCSLKGSDLGKPYPIFNKVSVWWGKIGLNFLSSYALLGYRHCLANCKAPSRTKTTHVFSTKSNFGKSDASTEKHSPRSPSAEQHSKEKRVEENTPARGANINKDSKNLEETPVKKKNLKPHTADAVSLLSERALSKSLRVSSLVLFFFPLGTGSFNFFCFLFRFSIPISHRGHNTWWTEKQYCLQHFKCIRPALTQPRMTG